MQYRPPQILYLQEECGVLDRGLDHMNLLPNVITVVSRALKLNESFSSALALYSRVFKI